MSASVIPVSNKTFRQLKPMNQEGCNKNEIWRLNNILWPVSIQNPVNSFAVWILKSNGKIVGYFTTRWDPLEQTKRLFSSFHFIRKEETSWRFLDLPGTKSINWEHLGRVIILHDFSHRLNCLFIWIRFICDKWNMVKGCRVWGIAIWGCIINGKATMNLSPTTNVLKEPEKYGILYALYIYIYMRIKGVNCLRVNWRDLKW